MAARRPRSTLVTVSAIGLFAFGLLVLGSSLARRMAAQRAPQVDQEALRKATEGLGETPPAEAPAAPAAPAGREAQTVLVTTTALRAGDEILPEFIQAKRADELLQQKPALRNPEADQNPEAPLLRGYYEQPEEVAGRYALIDLPPDTPLSLELVVDRSPFTNPLDAARRDRITIALPDEPTLYPLIVPNDRIDVFAVAGELATERVVADARVVAVNNIVTEQSGLLSERQEQEAFYSVRQQAAEQKRYEILRQAGRTGGAAAGADGQPPAEGEPADGATPPEGETAADGETPPEGDNATQGGEGAATEGAVAEGGAAGATGTPPASTEPPLPEGAAKAGRSFDGRTLTLQVTRSEAMVLAMTHRAPGVRLDFALHPRGR